MGSTPISSPFHVSKWKTIQSHGNHILLQSLTTQLQVQKHYSISNFSSHQQRYQISQIYRWRKSLQNTNVVKVYQYQMIEEKFGIQQEQMVFTEKIQRLNQKAKIYSKPEAFLIILHLVQGLQLLWHRFGHFNIDVFLLGISQDGIGKVWINQNYAINYVDINHKLQILNPNEQRVIINNLIRIVKNYVYNDDFMKKIDFPWNMNCKQLISYINKIRSSNILFNVKKVYSNRIQFKQDYDKLYLEYLQINNIQDDSINLITNQQKMLHIRPSTQIKQHNSQTLSSDSNSRTKVSNNSNETKQIFTQKKLQVENKKILYQPLISPMKNMPLSQAQEEAFQQKVVQKVMIRQNSGAINPDAILNKHSPPQVLQSLSSNTQLKKIHLNNPYQKPAISFINPPTQVFLKHSNPIQEPIFTKQHTHGIHMLQTNKYQHQIPININKYYQQIQHNQPAQYNKSIENKQLIQANLSIHLNEHNQPNPNNQYNQYHQNNNYNQTTQYPPQILQIVKQANNQNNGKINHANQYYSNQMLKVNYQQVNQHNNRFQNQFAINNVQMCESVVLQIKDLQNPLLDFDA